LADSCEQRGGLISVMTGPGEAMGVLKAMALGANGVFIGRPLLWALAVGWRESSGPVSRAAAYRDSNVQMLLGTKSLADLTPDLLSAAR
jgi:isopentenyl diphosphate isomerase/L-lactate dehydrogenase-like FMN-dependent dehydrogenase